MRTLSCILSSLADFALEVLDGAVESLVQLVARVHRGEAVLGPEALREGDLLNQGEFSGGGTGC